MLKLRRNETDMRLEWLRADIASARRATTFLAVLLTGSLLVNIVLAFLTVRMNGRERVVLVPPTIHKTFWVLNHTENWAI
jgi:conjugal transfer pilus assembly protein TraE